MEQGRPMSLRRANHVGRGVHLKGPGRTSSPERGHPAMPGLHQSIGRPFGQSRHTGGDCLMGAGLFDLNGNNG